MSGCALLNVQNYGYSKMTPKYKVTKLHTDLHCWVCKKRLGAIFYKVEPVSPVPQQGDYVCSERCANMYILQEME
jgi:hypothetical protein